MITILHVIDTWGPGGAETVCVELAAGLRNGRFRARTAVVREGWVHDALAARRLDPAVLELGRGPIDWRFLRGLIRECRRHRVHVIQSHLLTANLYSVLAGRLLGIPVVATFHGTVDVAPDDRWARLKLRIINAGAARLVFVSESLRAHFHGGDTVPGTRAVVVHNGVDPEAFRPAPNHALRSELGLPEGTVLVGALGNVRVSKGYDELLRVAARLRASHPALRFVVAGRSSPALMDRLLAQRAALGVEDRVHFLGFRDDPAAVLNGLDVYLSTSVSEGFSLTTVQAMAAALPVVATRSGGPEEIVTDAHDGLLVPVGDTAAIADALARLAADPALRTRLGQAGRATVLARFTLERMVSAYADLYDAVVPARPSTERHG